MPYGKKITGTRGVTGNPFEASWDSTCELGDDLIETGEEIVMADGAAVHWQCARDAGFTVLGK